MCSESTQIRNKLGRKKGKIEDKPQGTLKVAIQDPSYPECTTKVCLGHRETGWRPALLQHLWDRDQWPQGGMKWGLGPQAVCGPGRLVRTTED